MTITKQTAAEKIASYLRHEISLADLVSWAEDPMMDGQNRRVGPVQHIARRSLAATGPESPSLAMRIACGVHIALACIRQFFFFELNQLVYRLHSGSATLGRLR
jgi:hypothetical protein